MPSGACYLCGMAADQQPGNGDFIHIACSRCGRYTITGDAQLGLEQAPLPREAVGAVGGYVRENDRLTVTWQVLSRLRTLRPLPVSEKADRLLAALGVKHPAPGAVFAVPCSSGELLGRCWANNAAELHYLAADYLGEELRALTLGPSRSLNNGALEGVKISPSGWHRLAVAPDATGSKAFIAMWFDGSMDRVRDEALRPGIEDAGYDAVLVNAHEHVNRIDDEIVALIRRSRFIVADFTGNRGGVYFEAGFAHGLRLPVVWTCRAEMLGSGALHFDVDHFNFLGWSETDLPGFRRALTLRIESVVGRGPRRQGG